MLLLIKLGNGFCAVLQITRSRGLWWTRWVVTWSKPLPEKMVVLSLFSNVRYRTEKTLWHIFFWSLWRLKSDCISSVSHLNTVVMHKGSPFPCPLLSGDDWSYRAYSIPSVCPKRYMGNRRFLIKMAFPKCWSTMLIHEQHHQSLQLTASTASVK